MLFILAFLYLIGRRLATISPGGGDAAYDKFSTN